MKLHKVILDQKSYELLVGLSTSLKVLLHWNDQEFCKKLELEMSISMATVYELSVVRVVEKGPLEFCQQPRALKEAKYTVDENQQSLRINKALITRETKMKVICLQRATVPVESIIIKCLFRLGSSQQLHTLHTLSRYSASGQIHFIKLVFSCWRSTMPVTTK